jgi:Ser/Thr protein kinase RdoA (MazF antagonist)
MQAETPGIPAEVLAAWGMPGVSPAPLGSGLINQTWLLDDGRRRLVLQRLNPLFPPAINLDIEALTAHLAAGGLPTPRLVRTLAGEPWCEAGGGCWRALTYVEGLAADCMRDVAMAREAGALLGRFHRAVAGFDQPLHGTRSGIHDTPRHLAALRETLATQRRHPAWHRVAPLGEEILAAAALLAPLPARLPARLVHGDPKLNNLLFDRATGAGLCLVDLDTLGRMAVVLELGDALRSWCNPAGEDGDPVAFSLPYFAAAISGYAAAAGDWLQPEERAGIISGTETIILELAARFCADALNENYFGWNPDRYPSRGEHNRQRALRQLALFHSLKAQRQAAVAAAAAAFAGGGAE